MKLIIFVGLIAMAMADVNTILKESNDQFTAKMFNEVVNDKPDQSVIISAFSVLSPLAQLALASVGESHDELLKSIGLPNDNVTKEVFEGVNARMRAVKGVDLKMANRVYIAKDAELNSNFATLSRNVFNSDVKNVDFVENVKTAKEVNTWVEEQTNNKIKDLVDPTTLDGTTRALLVNAIYFKGTWKTPFDKAATVDSDFHVTKDKTVQVPTMHKTATYRYAESSELDAKLLELPYEGEESSFLIVLPNKIDGLKELQEKLKDPAAMPKAIDKLFSTEVIVSLPKFKIETTTDLKDILSKMQVKKLFDPSQARLENLLNKESNLFISNAIQKAFIEVNEEGAEAAAANDYGVSYLSAFIPDTRSFDANHPFMFYLTEEDFVLFSGVYSS